MRKNWLREQCERASAEMLKWPWWMRQWLSPEHPAALSTPSPARKEMKDE